MAKNKSLDDMRDEAYRRQDNLASDIDELIDRVKPKNALNRWKNELIGSMKGFSEAGDGKTPAMRTAVIAGGVIGVVLIGTGLALVLAGGDEEPEKARRRAAEQQAHALRKARAAKH